MEIISQPQPHSQRDPGYSKIGNSLGGPLPLSLTASSTEWDERTLCKYSTCKNGRQDEAAKEIIIHHMYHKWISEFNTSRP